MKSISALYIKLGSTLLLSLGILTGCGTFQLPQLTSNATDHDVKQFLPIEGKSRAYFFHGPVRTCKSTNCIDQKLNFPFSIYIDGVQIGTLASRDNYLRADIAPGKHLIQWRDIIDSPEDVQGKMEISMESGQAYFIRVSKGTSSELTPVALGAAGVKSTGQLENVGIAGQAEVLDRSLIVADRDAIQRLSGRASASNSAQQSSSSVPSSPIGIGGKLTELKDMYERGLITKDEYDGKRKQFLDAWK
jgi:hypothetical protein